MSGAGLPSLRRQVAIAHLAGVLVGAGATMLGPILPVLSRTWALSDAAAGTFLACVYVGGFSGAIASGWLGARLRLLTLLGLGLALFAMGLGGAALMLRMWMAPSLFVSGLGLGVINPVANLIVAKASFPSPAAALNLFNFSWAAGALAAPSAFAFALRWQPPAYVLLEFGILAAAATCLAAMANSAVANARLERGAAAGGSEMRSGNFGVVAITGILLFLYVGVETSVSIWLPTGAARWVTAGASQAAAAQTAFWASLMVGRLLAPVWLQYLAPRALIFTGLLCGALGMGGLLAAPGYRSLVAAAILAGLGLAPVNPTIVAAFTTKLGLSAARWLGPVFACAGLGGAVIPWLVGAISSQLNGLRRGFAAPLIAVGAMVCLELMMGRRHRRHPQD